MCFFSWHIPWFWRKEINFIVIINCSILSLNDENDESQYQEESCSTSADDSNQLLLCDCFLSNFLSWWASAAGSRWRTGSFCTRRRYWAPCYAGRYRVGRTSAPSMWRMASKVRQIWQKQETRGSSLKLWFQRETQLAMQREPAILIQWRNRSL